MRQIILKNEFSQILKPKQFFISENIKINNLVIEILDGIR